MSFVVAIPDVKTKFCKNWTLTFIPAILEYMRSTGKFLRLLSAMDEAGSY